MMEECATDCNNCFIKGQVAHKKAYRILARLDRLNKETYAITQELCCNMTCCPECHIDDFTHCEGCSISKELDAWEKKQSPQNHATQELGSEDEPSEGQALGCEKAEEGES